MTTTTTKSTVNGEVVGEREGGRRKRTRGRQKIEMKAIEDKNARQVCFSKRRDGVYKKANELSVLCGARLAVLFFSPASNPHSFAHPCVHSVSDSFLFPSSAAATETTADETQQQEEEVVREFDRVEERLTEAIEAEARRKDALDEAARLAAGGVWTDEDVRRAGVAALERVRAEAAERVHEVVVAAAAAEETMLRYAAAAAMDDALIGGDDVVHAPPRFSPVMMPQASLHPHFGRGGFGYSDFAAGGGYGYNFEVFDHGHGHGRHGAGEYYETETTTCNFFG